MSTLLGSSPSHHCMACTSTVAPLSDHRPMAHRHPVYLFLLVGSDLVEAVFRSLVDNGGGNSLNVQRTVQDLIVVGAAGCFLEGLPVFAIGVGLSTSDKACVSA
ncbi:Carboxyvinyl-carboxyphosphonate phosphorylmutase [Nymphaea thermarum]|nr:Carboxyvinyl-carboxyphosphonate phosphorylmutase [Nymphaea thermarum]